MPQHTRTRTLAAAAGSGWAHPSWYGTGPFSPVLYADGGEGGNEGEGGEDKGGKPDGGVPPKGAEAEGDDDALGEGGKKALKAEREARAAAEKRAGEAEAEAKRLRRSNASVKDTDVEAITKELRDEITADSNARLIKAEVKAAAAGLLADPSDAPKFIDLSKLTVGEDGEVDDKAIKKAIDNLLKDKPYLAGKQPWGDVGSGSHETPPVDVEPGMGRLRHAYANESKTK